MKKPGSVVLLGAIVAMVLLMTMLWAGVTVTNTVRDIRTDEIKMQCDAVDQALESWSRYHKGIKEETISYTEDGVSYRKKRLYPNELKELQLLGFIPKTIDLSIFRYTTRDGGAAYHLEVVLPNKRTYTSQGSTF